MAKVFREESAKEPYVELPDGRMMLLEDLVREHERLLKEESSRKAIISETKDDKAIASELKVGEWFRIDRDVIARNREKIRCKCDEAGTEGKAYWRRFEESNKIADENLNQYPRLIETYIFEHSRDYKTEQEMRDMCEKVGEGMCDEIICDLELQMRICNGESAIDLFKKADKLPHVRVIKLRNGGTGYFGGGALSRSNYPPADLYWRYFFPNDKNYYNYVPYAFRRVLS